MPFTKNYRRNYSMPKMASFLRHSVETVLLTRIWNPRPRTGITRSRPKPKSYSIKTKALRQRPKTNNTGNILGITWHLTV